LFDDSLNITAESARTMPGWFRYSLGAEYWYQNLFALRAGYMYRPEHEGLDTLSGLRAGLGFNIQGYQLDYALIPQGDLGYGHRASFTYFFGGGRALASEKQALINKARKAGKEALLAKQFQKAVDNFQKVLTFQPSDQSAQNSLQAAQKGIRQQEKNAELRDRFAKADKYRGLGQLQDAMDEYQRILVVDEGNSRAARSYAAIKNKFQAKEISKHLKIGRKAFKKLKWVDALLSWQAVLALDDKHKEATKMLAKTRKEMAKGGKGFKDPRIKEWYLQGLTMFEKGDYFAATKKWQRVLKIAPKHKQAKKFMNEATRLLDEKVTSLITAGDNYLKSGDYIRAAARWRRVLQVSPKHTRVLAKLKANQAAFEKLAKKLHLKGISEYTQGQYKQAIANWQDVLILVPSYSGTKDNIKKARAKLKATGK
jgi:tetratricopeptide (TPR) repeat protein